VQKNFIGGHPVSWQLFRRVRGAWAGAGASASASAWWAMYIFNPSYYFLVPLNSFNNRSAALWLSWHPVKLERTVFEGYFHWLDQCCQIWLLVANLATFHTKFWQKYCFGYFYFLLLFWLLFRIWYILLLFENIHLKFIFLTFYGIKYYW
jgi:hypothetical protein